MICVFLKNFLPCLSKLVSRTKPLASRSCQYCIYLYSSTNPRSACLVFFCWLGFGCGIALPWDRTSSGSTSSSSSSELQNCVNNLWFSLILTACVAWVIKGRILYVRRSAPMNSARSVQVGGSLFHLPGTRLLRFLLNHHFHSQSGFVFLNKCATLYKYSK